MVTFSWSAAMHICPNGFSTGQIGVLQKGGNFCNGNYVKIREHTAGYKFSDFEKNIYKYIINELIRINFMSTFGLLKNCHRLWVTF